MINLEKIKPSEIKPNERNPRFIDEDALENLKRNIEKFPKFLELRPIVVDKDNVIVGGNMRHRAVTELGWEEVSVVRAESLSDDQLKAFVILDNTSAGSWDGEILTEDYDLDELLDFGIKEDDLDFSNIDLLPVSEVTGENTEVVAPKFIPNAKSVDHAVFECLVKYNTKTTLISTLSKIKKDHNLELLGEAVTFLIDKFIEQNPQYHEQ